MNNYLLNEPLSAEQFYKVRSELEEITRRYLKGLAESQTAAEEYAHWLSTIVDSIGAGLIVFDHKLELILANHSALELAGWDITHLSRDEFRKKFRFSVDGGKTRLDHDEEPIVVAMREKRRIDMEGFVTGYGLPPEGIWVRVHASPIIGEAENVIGGVTIIKNITEIKRLQKQRDALTTLLTHDLKNHMASEDMIIDILKDRYESKFDQEDMRLLSALRANNNRYLDLAKTLLELFRCEKFGTEFSPQSIDVQELLNFAVEMNTDAASTRNISIKLKTEDGLPALFGMFTALRQVFHNLVQNAVFASPSDETVEIFARLNKSRLLVDVRDNGPGLTKEEIDNLFLSTNTGNSKVNIHSTRLGLCLSHMLVEDHGGTITCLSKPSKGTTFQVELPFKYQDSSAKLQSK